MHNRLLTNRLAYLENPGITDGEHTWAYQGELYMGQGLTIASDGTARLYYGQARLAQADLPAEGLDVSARVVGTPLRLRHGLARITYRDEALSTLDPKITVRLFYPEAEGN